ncbi:CDP-paratose 2-epimerase [Brevundimonas subvibrioides]|uniref:GDP-mannose 4,6-dehydratase n=1 Tax=Brevundimonas subvibrioides TaxID=74313 RepID=UPI0032D5683A
MRILVTGGCGFLGSNLAAEAIESGHEVCVFDNLSRFGATANLDWLQATGTMRFVHGDIRNTDDVMNVVGLAKPDAIFHLAGQVAMTTSIERPRMDFEVNTLGTFNLLEATRQNAPDASVVYSSTNKVYGDLEWAEMRETETRYEPVDFPLGFNEKAPLEFHSPYGASKGAADQYMQDYHRIYGLKTVVFRHSSMYGGRQFATADQGWVGWFCQKAVEQARSGNAGRFTISGNGKQVRDVLHGDDMKTLYFSALKNIEQAQGQAFNVGGGMANSLSLLELLAMLEKNLGVDLRYDKLPARQSDQRVFVADLTKARDVLGWSPTVTAEEGIKRMVAWTQSLDTPQ